MSVSKTLVNVRAGVAIALISAVASTGVRSDRVRAGSVGVASVSVVGTLIDIRAAHTIALVSAVTRARESSVGVGA